jgi:glycosyltransferase involved in cell wall biosynthesis
MADIIESRSSYRHGKQSQAVVSLNNFKLPITAILAVKNEEKNIGRCIGALGFVAQIIVVDSHSKDQTSAIATVHGAQVVQFDYQGGYPKKRQWAMDTIPIDTQWMLLIDADEVVPKTLVTEIRHAIERDDRDAYFIRKGFHFLGRRFRFGGFSHQAVLLFRRGRARFEKLFDDDAAGLDMEVHERLIVKGKTGVLKTPLIHEDFKGIEAYIERHNRYSTWEAKLRCNALTTGVYGNDPIAPRLFGNPQERRRALKAILIRLPLEHLVWFWYHFLFKLGFMEGRPGLIACQIRASYIAQVRAKVYEMKMNQKGVRG